MRNINKLSCRNWFVYFPIGTDKTVVVKGGNENLLYDGHSVSNANGPPSCWYIGYTCILYKTKILYKLWQLQKLEIVFKTDLVDYYKKTSFVFYWFKLKKKNSITIDIKR